MTGVFFSFSSFCKLCSFGCVCLVIEAGLLILYLKKSEVQCTNGQYIGSSDVRTVLAIRKEYERRACAWTQGASGWMQMKE